MIRIPISSHTVLVYLNILLLTGTSCHAGFQPAEILTIDDDGYCVPGESQQSDSCSTETPKDCFRAAVFEHLRIEPATGIEAVATNLATFEKVAKIANANHVNLLVFPEDGLFMGPRDFMIPVIEEVPNPKLLDRNNNNPCIHTKHYSHLKILTKLSCMARDNHMYIVANYGTKESCKPGEKVSEQICPDRGYFILNTDVVLDEQGNYIARYRKYNLFIEYFDKAPLLETVHFVTRFGKFGIFTCFDMMFKSPAIDLVEQYAIDTAIFPTWWYDELPLLSAIQFQDAWSWANKVNLLAANIHKRGLGSVGSSIFSNLNSVYTKSSDTESKLVIANLPSKPSLNTSCPSGFSPKEVVVEQEESGSKYIFKHHTLRSNDSIYSFNQLKAKETVCNGNFCCHVDYEVASDVLLDTLNLVILIVRDAPRPGYYNWFEQKCAIGTLALPLASQKMDDVLFSEKAVAKFKKLSLTGAFNTKYVFPVAAHNINQLISRNKRNYNCDQSEDDTTYECILEYSGQEPAEIYAFGLYGRIYEKDQMPEGW